jgi:hypothetical protein
LSQTCPRRSEGGFRQIENGQGLVTLIDQGIDEARSSPANVDNGGTARAPANRMSSREIDGVS